MPSPYEAPELTEVGEQQEVKKHEERLAKWIFTIVLLGALAVSVFVGPEINRYWEKQAQKKRDKDYVEQVLRPYLEEQDRQYREQAGQTKAARSEQSEIRQ